MSSLCRRTTRALFSLVLTIAVMSTWILLPAPTQAEALSSSQDEHQLSDSLQVSTCLGDNNETLKSLCTTGENGEESPLHDGALRLRTTPVARDAEREIDGGYELAVHFNPSMLISFTLLFRSLMSVLLSISMLIYTAISLGVMINRSTSRS